MAKLTPANKVPTPSNEPNPVVSSKSTEATTVELSNGFKFYQEPNGNRSGELPSCGLAFEVNPRKLKHTQKLEGLMGGSAGVSDYIEEAALRLFSMLVVDCSEDIGKSETDRLNWLLNNVPEYPDGIYLVEVLFHGASANSGGVEIDRTEGTTIYFKSGHTVEISEDNERLAVFPVCGVKARFRQALMGDSNAITRAMGGAKEKQNKPVEAIIRTMTRLCTSWGGGNATMSMIADIDEGEDSQYLAEIYASFRTNQAS